MCREGSSYHRALDASGNGAYLALDFEAVGGDPIEGLTLPPAQAEPQSRNRTTVRNLAAGRVERRIPLISLFSNLPLKLAGRSRRRRSAAPRNSRSPKAV